MLSVYSARSMTGRIKEDVVREALNDKMFLESCGFNVLCPVIAEGVQPTKQVLKASKKALAEYWPRDKQMIREAHILIDFSPHKNSEGVKHEIGYARYSLWKPIVRIFPEGQMPAGSSVSYLEDDFVCDSLIEAVEYILRVHGTLFKRFNWRLKMLNRCLLKWIVFQMGEWK